MTAPHDLQAEIADSSKKNMHTKHDDGFEITRSGRLLPLNQYFADLFSESLPNVTSLKESLSKITFSRNPPKSPTNVESIVGVGARSGTSLNDGKQHQLTSSPISFQIIDDNARIIHPSPNNKNENSHYPIEIAQRKKLSRWDSNGRLSKTSTSTLGKLNSTGTGVRSDVDVNTRLEQLNNLPAPPSGKLSPNQGKFLMRDTSPCLPQTRKQVKTSPTALSDLQVKTTSTSLLSTSASSSSSSSPKSMTGQVQGKAFLHEEQSTRLKSQDDELPTMPVRRNSKDRPVRSIRRQEERRKSDENCNLDHQQDEGEGQRMSQNTVELKDAPRRIRRRMLLEKLAKLPIEEGGTPTKTALLSSSLNSPSCSSSSSSSSASSFLSGTSNGSISC